jgi:hypothetical protein
MKKIIYASAIFASMVMASCGGSSSNDLEQAQTFAVDVAKKISMNQKDSVVALYPDAEKADSFVTSFVADSVKVLPTDSATIFTAELGGGKEFTIQKFGEDSLVVTQSKGLFAYAAADLEYGKKTGMYADSLSDVQNLERMADKSALHQYLLASFKFKNPLVMKNLGVSWHGGDCNTSSHCRANYRVTNTSDNAVSASDYKLTMSGTGQMGNRWNNSMSGRNLAPGASTTYSITLGVWDIIDRANVVYTASKAKQFEQNYVYKGDEYDRFLKAKGKK